MTALFTKLDSNAEETLNPEQMTVPADLLQAMLPAKGGFKPKYSYGDMVFVYLYIYEWCSDNYSCRMHSQSHVHKAIRSDTHYSNIMNHVCIESLISFTSKYFTTTKGIVVFMQKIGI